MSGAGRFFVAVRACLAGLLAGAACMAWAQSAQTGAAADALHRNYAVSLEQYNRYAQWNLRGVDGSRGVVFGLRDDERINDLQLDLAYRYSPALLQELSHLNVVLNGEVIASLPLPGQPSDEANRAQVVLPLAHLQPYNFLELQLIGHYTMGCEDPLHPELWANIDASSRLLFDVERLVLPDDLGLLPSPFFDPRDVRGLEVPFVLGRPSDKRLEAAGIVASWLGALSGYRGARFTALSDEIPQQGHAVIVLGANESLPGITLPEAEGPTLAMRANPHDPAGKLLVITGRNDDEIRSAAASLALGAQALSGPTATVAEVQGVPRKPYDAPNWLPADRPVALGELLPLREFTVSGYEPGPISVGLRLPPDLSDWRTKAVPMNLLYRHSAIDADDGATLDVLVNQQRVQHIELADNEENARRLLARDGSALKQKVFLPLSMLESQAELQFRFHYRPPFHSECRGSLIDARRSAIDPRSTIDLSGLPHHKAMPDLAAFSTSGFPFSRMADLSETAVVMRTDAHESEFAAFLTLLGRMGQATGHPATGVTVQRDTAGVADKDLLLIEAGTRSETLSGWDRYLPLPERTATSRSAADAGIGGWIGALAERLARSPLRSSFARPIAAPADGAYVAGFQSPMQRGRSVVVVAGADGAGLQAAVESMIADDVQSKRLQGSLALVREGRIESLSSSKSYYVGNLSFYQTIAWFMSRHPLLLFVVYLLGAVLIAIVLYLSLRARAQRRLRAGSSDSQ